MPGFKKSVTGVVGTGADARDVKLTTGDKTQTVQIKTTDPVVGWVKLRIDDPAQFYKDDGSDLFNPAFADVSTMLKDVDRRLGGH